MLLHRVRCSTSSILLVTEYFHPNATAKSEIRYSPGATFEEIAYSERNFDDASCIYAIFDKVNIHISLNISQGYSIFFVVSIVRGFCVELIFLGQISNNTRANDAVA